MIRVLIADDHPVVRFGLAAIISAQSDMTLSGQSGTGEEAVAICAKKPIDVVLVDLRMPGMGGVEAIRQLREAHAKMRFIVLTTYDGDEDIYRALEAGAQGYLLKGMSHDDLLNAIRAVHAGRKFLPLPVSKTLADRPPCSDLSPREKQVLELIVKGLSNREIGETLEIREATVKWHINLILSRLGVSDRTQAAMAAVQRGIIHL